MDGAFPKDEYHARIKWLMLSRVVVATFLLVSLVFVQTRYHIYHFPAAVLSYFAVAFYTLSGIYWYLLRTFRNLRLLAYIQICGDILLVSWLVSLTGVIDSGFTLLYHITIITASIILYRRGGYLSASLASILYGGMLDLQYYNMLGFVRSPAYTPFQVLYLLFVNILSFYLVALLSSTLSDRLRKTGQELWEKSLDFEDLRVLQDNILRSVGSGIVTMNMNAAITSWNNGAEQITGYRFEEIRDNWQEVFGDGIRGLFGQTEALQERPVRFEGQIRKRDGNAANLGFTASLLKDDRGAVKGIILTFQDITRMIEMEQQMRWQERLAMVGSLAAGIAHEIRNPLASLSGSIQMLQSDLNLTGDNKRLMDIVLREADRLNTIITEFLDYARPPSIVRERVDLGMLVQETVDILRKSRSLQEGIDVRCDVSPRLFVAGDAQRLRQVFWNLFLNAAQAITGDGAVSVSVAPASGDQPDHGLVRVSDTGCGIPAERIGNIFDPFYTTKSDGTGLGLAIAYRIIDDHGGSIDVKSEPNRGSIFTVRLPLEDAKPYLHRGGARRAATRTTT